jgi:ribokinase
MIYNIGSINVDYVYRVPHLVKPGETLASHELSTVLGGKGANQSVAAARAGCPVSHVGCIGQSDQWALAQLTQWGVNTQPVRTVDGPSGHAIIQVDDAGENSIVLFGGANHQLTVHQLDEALSHAKETDWVLLQNECNAPDNVFAQAKAKSLSLAFNPAPMSESVLQLPLQQVDCFIVNEVEARGVAANERGGAQELVSALAQQFPNATVALTLGAGGVELIHAGHVTHCAAPSVNVVDTTGAGDTFVGYFLAGLVAGLEPAAAAHRACFAAALSVTKPGATPSIPTIQDVEQFMASQA